MTGQWWRRAGVAVGCWAALWLVLAGLDNRPQPVALGGAVAAAAALGWLAVDLGGRSHRASWVDDDTFDFRSRGNDGRLTRLAEDLNSAQDREAVARDVHRRLVSVIDDRLEVAYGVSRRDDPVAARAILGPELDDYVTGSPRHARTYADQLSGLLTKIEAL